MAAHFRPGPDFHHAGIRRPLQPGQQHGNGPEEQRIERDGDERPGEDQVVAVSRQQVERAPQCGKDERELPDLGERGRDDERRDGEHGGPNGATPNGAAQRMTAEEEEIIRERLEQLVYIE